MPDRERRSIRESLRTGRGVPVTDEAWRASLESIARRWRHLGDDDLDRLATQARTFDRTRFWEAVGDIEVTAAMRAHIASHASLLTMNIGLDFLSDVSSVLIEPAAATRTTRHRDGPIVSEGNACVTGEAMLHGPVRVAWRRVETETTENATTSVILHEFAHKIDMRDGVSDGVPPMQSREATRTFTGMLDATLRAIRVPSAETPLRAYGATNRQELFAVATEAFFLQPESLRQTHVGLHAALVAFYRQDPVTTPTTAYP